MRLAAVPSGAPVPEHDSVPLDVPSGPQAQRRTGDHRTARIGSYLAVVLALCAAGILFRLAGMGVGNATSSLGAPGGRATLAESRRAGADAPAAAASQSEAGPQSGAAPAPAPTPERVGREHTVVSGDTLFAIAGRYGTTVDALVGANNLTSRAATLKIGQRLIVPG